MSETAIKLMQFVCEHTFSFLLGKCPVYHCDSDSRGISICQNSSETNVKLVHMPLCG